MNNSPTQSQLEEYLAGISKHFPKQKTLESVVLEHGRPFEVLTPRPKGIRKGRDKACFMNAYRLADRHGLEYVEGFAIADIAIQFPIHHAWVVNEKGLVIETTWAEVGLAYFGIVFDMEFMNKVMLETGTYGILDYRSKTFREYAK